MGCNIKTSSIASRLTQEMHDEANAILARLADDGITAATLFQGPALESFSIRLWRPGEMARIWD